MSLLMTKPTKWHVRPAKTQIILGICPVRSESSLYAWRKLGSLATHWLWSNWADWVDSGWSESSLGVQSLCWFCHEAAHMIFIFDLDYCLGRCNITLWGLTVDLAGATPPSEGWLLPWQVQHHPLRVDYCLGRCNTTLWGLTVALTGATPPSEGWLLPWQVQHHPLSN